MPEYIEREAVVERINNSICSWCRDCNSNAQRMVSAYKDVLSRIQNIPTADVVEVRHGKWLYVSGVGRYAEYECSECKAHVCFDEKIDGTIPVYNGCPHCLAKMDGKENGNAVHR